MTPLVQGEWMEQPTLEILREMGTGSKRLIIQWSQLTPTPRCLTYVF